jgi:hypothetical protein
MEFKRDPDFLKKRTEIYNQKKEETGGGGRDFIFKEKLPYFSPKEGENIIRLLPGLWPDAYTPWVEAYVHYSIGPNNSQFLCPAKMLKKACPICEEVKHLTDAGKDEKEIRPLYPSLRAILWLIDRMDEAKGPLIWVAPYVKIAKEIITISFSRRTGEPIFVDDPETGRDILFTKTGKLVKTQYSGVRKDDDPSALHTDETVAKAWLGFIQEKLIPNIIQYKEYKYIKDTLFGIGNPETENSVAITSAQTKVKETKDVVANLAAPAKATQTESAKAEIPVGDGISVARLKSMSRPELEVLIESKKIGVDPEDWKEDEDLVQAIALDLGLTA